MESSLCIRLETVEKYFSYVILACLPAHSIVKEGPESIFLFHFLTPKTGPMTPLRLRSGLHRRGKTAPFDYAQGRLDGLAKWSDFDSLKYEK